VGGEVNMDLIIITVIFLYTVAIIAYLLKPSKTVFVIKIKYNFVKLVKGSAPSVFIAECKEIAKIRKTINGKIFGIREKGGIKLEFSRSINDSEKQVFRNVWPSAYLGNDPPPESGNRKKAKLF
jgi:hypothetical protein